jgi:hypothetical protein
MRSRLALALGLAALAALALTALSLLQPAHLTQPTPQADLEHDAALRLLVVVGYDPAGKEVGASDLLPRVREMFEEETDTPWRVVTLSGEMASEQEIRTALSRELGGTPHPDDQVVLWVIAHGGTPEDGSQDLGVLLSAASGQGTYGVPVGRLQALVEALPVTRAALVLDVCYAAEAATHAPPAHPQLARRRAHIITGAGPGAPAYITADGGGPFFSGCLLEALGGGRAGLLAATAEVTADAAGVAAAVTGLTISGRAGLEALEEALSGMNTCMARRHLDLYRQLSREDPLPSPLPVQRPQLSSGGAYELPFRADLSGEPLLVLDGASRTFEVPAEVRVTWDARERGMPLESPGGIAAFRREAATLGVSLRFGGEDVLGPVWRRVGPGQPLLISPGPGVHLRTGTPDWSWLRVTSALAEAGRGVPEAPGFEEVAARTGILSLVDGLPTAVTPITWTQGGRPRELLAITRRWSHPVLVENTAPPGAVPRYVDVTASFGADALPGDGGAGHAAQVYDLDQDGAPELCYPVLTPPQLICLGERGPVELAGLGLSRAARAPPLQADFDGDGDLDLVFQDERAWITLLWDGERYREGPAVVSAPRVRAQRPALVDIDPYGGVDLLFEQGEGYRLYQNQLAYGGGWSSIPLSPLGLPSHRRLRVLDIYPNGLRDLAVLAEDGDPFEGGVQLLAAGEGGLLFDVDTPPEVVRPSSPTDDRPEGEVVDLAAGDLDGDGLSDLILVHRGWHQPPHRVFLQRPQLPGGWLQLTGIEGLDLHTDDRQVLVHDLNGDGRPDLLALNGNEAPSKPPLGCCRVFLGHTGRPSPSLRLELPEGQLIAGTEVVISAAGRRSWFLLDGSRRVLTAALPGGTAPDFVRVRWPDGRTLTVEDPERFVAIEGGYLLALSEQPMPRPTLLVGPYTVDLSEPQAREAVRALPGLEGVTAVDWALRLEEDLVAVHGTLEGRGQWVWWLSDAGEVLGDVSSSGCSWASAQPSQRRVVAACEPGARKHLGLLPYRGAAWELAGLEALEIPGAPRTLAEAGGVAWLSSGRRLVTGRDPQTMAPLAPLEETTAACEASSGSLPCGLSGGYDREHLQANKDRLLVLDTVGRRVEIWDVADPASPALESAVPVRAPLGHPAWDPYRGWWWIPVRGGLEAVSPEHPGLPIRRHTWDKQIAALLPVGPEEIAVLWSHEGQLYLEVLNHRTWELQGPRYTFPGHFRADQLLTLGARQDAGGTPPR